MFNSSKNTIEKEPGTSVPPTRLTSFKVPRDLTLGGNARIEKVKKVYVPNLNVQRRKKEDIEPVKNDIRKCRDQRKKPEHKPKGKQVNLIQSTGIFSEGISDIQRKRTSRSGTRESNDYKTSKLAIERPKLQVIPTINKEEEDRKLQLLLRDDFIDDGNEVTLDNAPIILPTTGEVKLYNEGLHTNSLKKHDEDVDVKPTILENGEVYMKKHIKVIPHVKQESKHLQSIPEILESKPNNNYILMQFPDCLPGLRPDDNTALASTSKRHEENMNDSNNENRYCTLSDLKEGYLGKLQILRSGKSRLILGENQLVVDVGLNPNFCQDLIAVKIANSRQVGELINLGLVSSTLICAPDWETMLANL